MQLVVFALVGGLVGVLVMQDFVGGLIAGGALGVLAARVSQLQTRLGRLERRLAAAAGAASAEAASREAASAEAASPVAASREAASADAVAPGDAAPRTAAAPIAPEPPQAITTAARSASGASRAVGRVAPSAARPVAERAPAAKRSRLIESTELAWIERAFAAVGRWFTSGNVPVKVGVLLSVFGVGFLVKEAIDRNWILISLELRLAFVALFALVLLVLGWRLRERNPGYAVSIQGGGVAMLYVTIYASFAIYGLLPAGVAFAMLFAVTVAGAALAVLQDARSLAVLGIVGGFLAPVLTSTDTGNHVALFSYYAVLDLAIFGIAWFRAWRELNLLGFFFTFAIGTLWAFDAYRPELFASTEPFLVLFVALYIFIPVLFAWRVRPELKGFIDGTLVFGTPLVGFALQAQLVGDTRYGLAISALALAAVYFVLAWQLFRTRNRDLRALAEAELGLGAAFLALAVPLALDARWTSAAWALQGAAMTWLGVRQHRPLAKAGGALLQLGAGAALANHWAFGAPEEGLLGGITLGALMIAVAGAFSSRCLDRGPDARRRDEAAAVYLGWAILWWLVGGLVEIGRHASPSVEVHAVFVFIAITVLAAILAAPRLDWPRLNAAGFLAIAAIVLGALVSPLSHAHPLTGWGVVAWPTLLGAHYIFLRLREEQFPSWQGIAHVASYWAMAYLLALEVGWWAARYTDGAWMPAAVLAAVAAFVLVTLTSRDRPAWPLAQHRHAYILYACAGTLALLVAATIVTNVVSAGDARPLPYVPIANPLELATLFVLFVAYRGWQAACELRPVLASHRAHAGLAFAAFGLVLLTAAVARAVHHLGGVPFELEAMSRSTMLQASLSIVWGTAALMAMLLGARGRRRGLWLVGAALMAIVVVKLFVVELGNAGTVGRVVSFLGVGVLLLVVGYFAPAPPRAAMEQQGA